MMTLKTLSTTTLTRMSSRWDRCNFVGGFEEPDSSGVVSRPSDAEIGVSVPASTDRARSRSFLGRDSSRCGPCSRPGSRGLFGQTVLAEPKEGLRLTASHRRPKCRSVSEVREAAWRDVAESLEGSRWNWKKVLTRSGREERGPPLRRPNWRIGRSTSRSSRRKACTRLADLRSDPDRLKLARDLCVPTLPTHLDQIWNNITKLYGFYIFNWKCFANHFKKAFKLTGRNYLGKHKYDVSHHQNHPFVVSFWNNLTK